MSGTNKNIHIHLSVRKNSVLTKYCYIKNNQYNLPQDVSAALIITPSPASKSIHYKLYICSHVQLVVKYTAVCPKFNSNLAQTGQEMSHHALSVMQTNSWGIQCRSVWELSANDHWLVNQMVLKNKYKFNHTMQTNSWGIQCRSV